MDFSLEGKSAFVCGSTKGIGRAIAEVLATLGARIVLIARDETALREGQHSLETSHGQRHGYVCADFSEPELLEKRVGDFLLNSPPIQILVNNTGGPPGGKAIEAGPEAYRDAFSKHLICNQVLSQAIVPGMKKEGFGRIINIISTSVKQPIPGLGVSNTTRGAVASWAKTLAHELGPFGITVNNVLPGATKTQRLFSLIEADAQSEGKTIEEVQQALISEIPARRFAEPAEVAQAVAFLASPAASYINGVSLPVDGGVISCL